MIEKPALVVMAAGMGSRYGGLKQIDPVGDNGEIILDYSLYDAMLAGFEEVVFVIRKEHEKDFRDLMDNRAGSRLHLHYAFQDLNDLPEGFTVPDGREKPWGTGQAVLSARDIVGGPFAVINADDYYGSAAFQHMYDFLESCAEASGTSGDDSSSGSASGSADTSAKASDSASHYAMVAFKLANTLSETGHVSRGVCQVEKGKLADITERTMIKSLAGDHGSSSEEVNCQSHSQQLIGYSEDGGETWITLPPDTPVSMNFWGFTNDFMKALEKGFHSFLEKVLGTKPSASCSGENTDSLGIDPLKAEFFLPGVVDDLIKAGKADVKILTSSDKWYGVTYKEDKADVVNALRSMKDKGIYPEVLWG